MPHARATRNAAAQPAPVAPPRAPAHPRLAGARDDAVDSPARILQEDLAAAIAEPDFGLRWSPRRTLAFIAGSCGLFWLAFYLIIRAI